MSDDQARRSGLRLLQPFALRARVLPGEGSGLTGLPRVYPALHRSAPSASEARDLGTSLIVIVNNDVQAAPVLNNSVGPSVSLEVIFFVFCRPRQALRRSKRAQAEDMTLPARERVKLVRSLQCVDAAVEAVDLDDSVAETLQLLHPDIFANGGGRAPAQQEVQVCQKLRIQMVDGLGIQLLSLAPYTQHYDWGKPRNESIIAALTGQQSPHLTDEPDAQKPFAEMWMGDHPSGPARVVSPGSSPRHDRVVHRSTSLQDVFHKTPSVLGPALQDAKQLPFLLKVLSIHKALSIQAHPDRDLASRLHRERPDIYKDPNHKPEIAIALTDDFQALCTSAEVAADAYRLNSVNTRGSWSQLCHAAEVDSEKFLRLCKFWRALPPRSALHGWGRCLLHTSRLGRVGGSSPKLLLFPKGLHRQRSLAHGQVVFKRPLRAHMGH